MPTTARNTWRGCARRRAAICRSRSARMSNCRCGWGENSLLHGVTALRTLPSSPGLTGDPVFQSVDDEHEHSAILGHPLSRVVTVDDEEPAIAYDPIVFSRLPIPSTSALTLSPVLRKCGGSIA